MILCCFTAAFFLRPSWPLPAREKVKKPVVATPVRGYADDLAERTAILAKLKELVENGQGDHALPVLNSRLAKNPDDSDPCLCFAARFFLNQEMMKQLWQTPPCSDCRCRQPDARAQLGALLARGGQLEAASKELAAALALDPTQLRPRLNLALCLQMLNKPQAAAEFDEAVRRSPKSPDALLGRARLKEQAGDRAGAIADYRVWLPPLCPKVSTAVFRKNTALLEEQKSLWRRKTPLISGNHKAAGTGAAVAAIGKNQQAAVTISAPLARPVSVSGTGAL